MKKSLTYATIVTVAVLFGVALMLAPFLAFPTSIKTDTYTEQLPPRNLTPENLQILSAKSESSAGVMPNYPMDAIWVGLMLTFSLIFAFFVSSRWKKKIV
jgi:hypothetical protein